MSGRPLTVLMVSSEAVPFAKTGGLADVSTALTQALGELGHHVTLVMPRYRGVGAGVPTTRRSFVSLGTRWFDVGYAERPLSARTRVVFVDCAELYDREGLYGMRGRDYPDNAWRFAVLARAALDDPGLSSRVPDVIHAHDWQGGLVPVYARTRYATHPLVGSAVTVFTIHNIAYQGCFPESVLDPLDLDRSLFTVDGVEFWGQASFLKGGINLADGVTTVSRTYAREIMTAEYGYGLEGVVTARRARLRGVPNGIDTDTWNPETDPYLPAPFSSTALEGKRLAKRQLLERFGLPSTGRAARRPVVGMVARLVSQKGLDLIAEVVDRLPGTGAVFVVLGSGEARYEKMWRDAARAHPSTFGVEIGYDEALAHLIEGGSDMFLMPSRYEPCGLNQMYSMRYGTVPIVRATGGLDDAVTAFDAANGAGTGFKFVDFTADALLESLGAAVRVFGDPSRWRALQLAGMERDFSWTASATAYVRHYEEFRAARLADATQEQRESDA